MKKIPVRHINSTRKEQTAPESFSIRKVQDLLAGKDLLHDLHRHDFIFILVLNQGQGSHEIDFTTYNVADNSVFFLRPGQVHQLQLKAGSTGYLMEFNAAFYHPNDRASTQRLRKASNKNFCQLELVRFEKLYAVLTYIFQEYTGREEGYLDIVKANLDIFFVELVRQSQHTTSSSKNNTPYTQDRFEEFLELLEIHIGTHKQVSQYSDLMSLSQYQLNEITKASVGKTASGMITDHIILEAKRHLLATPYQIKDIADQLGYEDVSYFIRFFKKHSGQSPEAFRHSSG